MSNGAKNGFPRWLTDRAGLTEKVPPPWTPVQVRGDTFSCWGREHRFGSRPLPAQIVSRKKAMLSRPMEILLSVGGKEYAWEKCEVKELFRHKNGRFARRTVVGKLADFLLESESTLFYEGAMFVTLTIKPVRKTVLERLAVRISMRKEESTLGWATFSPGGKDLVAGFGSEAIPEEGWKGRFHPPLVWLGNEERGLGWFAGSDEGWDPGEDALELGRDSKSVVFQMGVIRSPRIVEFPLTVRFGIQANPWKPAPEGCEHFNIYHHSGMYDLTRQDMDNLQEKGVHVLILHSLWSHLHAYPETAYKKELRALVHAAHRRKMKILVYFGSEFSHGAPEWADWGVRWAIRDPNRGFVPVADRPKFPAPHVCFNTEWRDFIISGIHRLLRRYDLDGVYLDGWPDWLGEPCRNRLHGCGYVGTDGQVHGTYSPLENRDLMERVYVTVKNFKKDGLVDLHSNPGPCVVSSPFGTSCFGGEGYAGDYRKVSLETFRACHMGLAQWGVFSELIATANIHYGIAIGLLHNVLPRAGAYELGHHIVLEQLASVWRTRDAFVIRKAESLPYWKNGSVVSVPDGPIKVSLWNRTRKGALLVVSNLGMDDVKTSVSVSWKKLGYRKASDLQALDMLPPDLPVSVTPSGLELEVRGGKCRLLFIAPKKSPLWPAMKRCYNRVAGMSFATVKVDDWVLLGPFGDPDVPPKRTEGGFIEVPDGYQGMETPYIPEDSPVDIQAVHRIMGGKEQGWLRACAENHLLILRPEVARYEWNVAYAYTRIYFPTLVPRYENNLVEFLIRTPHAYKVWVNGELIHTYGGAGTARYGQRPTPKDPDVVPAVLHPGWNTLLVKMVSRQGAELFFDITGKGGSGLPPLSMKPQE